MTTDAKIFCSKCRQDWGVRVRRGGVAWYLVAIKGFNVFDPQDRCKGRPKKWKDAKAFFAVDEMTPEEETRLATAWRERQVEATA